MQTNDYDNLRLEKLAQIRPEDKPHWPSCNNCEYSDSCSTAFTKTGNPLPCEVSGVAIQAKPRQFNLGYYPNEVSAGQPDHNW